MRPSFPPEQPLAPQPRILWRWLTQLGFRSASEKPINLAVMETRKLERRIMRRDASAQAEKPPLPFA
jgi:hypothetical protein